MIKIILVVCLGSFAWCAAAQTKHNTSGLALQPIAVDCTKAAEMSAELEAIIVNPGRKNNTWDTTLSWVGGISTSEQRQSSAKTVLWNIRTQCRGF